MSIVIIRVHTFIYCYFYLFRLSKKTIQNFMCLINIQHIIEKRQFIDSVPYSVENTVDKNGVATFSIQPICLPPQETTILHCPIPDLWVWKAFHQLGLKFPDTWMGCGLGPPPGSLWNADTVACYSVIDNFCLLDYSIVLWSLVSKNIFLHFLLFNRLHAVICLHYSIYTNCSAL